MWLVFVHNASHAQQQEIWCFNIFCGILYCWKQPWHGPGCCRASRAMLGTGRAVLPAGCSPWDAEGERSSLTPCPFCAELAGRGEQQYFSRSLSPLAEPIQQK